MRHISLNDLLAQVFATDAGKAIEKRLSKGRKKLARKKAQHTRKKYIDDNGPNKWTPIKDQLTPIVGDKCWYTEVEMLGGPLAIDHYRPSALYSWLALDATNYRVACPYSNSPKYNQFNGLTGGKGDNFPLLSPGIRALDQTGLAHELPVLLDPCKAEDCKLLAFDTEGHPILNPEFDGNATALDRVNQSKILLNLDLAAFNAAREELYHAIKDDVEIYEDLSAASAKRTTIHERLESKIAPKAQFSMAARQYLQLFRHLDWVQRLLNPTPPNLNQVNFVIR
jgi:hypothetical protein